MQQLLLATYTCLPLDQRLLLRLGRRTATKTSSPSHPTHRSPASLTIAPHACVRTNRSEKLGRLVGLRDGNRQRLRRRTVHPRRGSDPSGLAAGPAACSTRAACGPRDTTMFCGALSVLNGQVQCLAHPRSPWLGPPLLSGVLRLELPIATTLATLWPSNSNPTSRPGTSPPALIAVPTVLLSKRACRLEHLCSGSNAPLRVTSYSSFSSFA